MLVQLHDWEINLIDDLSKANPNQLNEIMKLLVSKDKELSKFGIEAADRLLPQMPQAGRPEGNGSGTGSG